MTATSHPRCQCQSTSEWNGTLFVIIADQQPQFGKNTEIKLDFEFLQFNANHVIKTEKGIHNHVEQSIIKFNSVKCEKFRCASNFVVKRKRLN